PSCCFFYCYGALRDLHSFPTRRSSDLAPVERVAIEVPVCAARLALAVCLDEDALGGDSCRHQHRRDTLGAAQRQLAVVGLRAARSEEHTSELQSRGHLVCRLLLEKKKQ